MLWNKFKLAGVKLEIMENALRAMKGRGAETANSAAANYLSHRISAKNVASEIKGRLDHIKNLRAGQKGFVGKLADRLQGFYDDVYTRTKFNKALNVLRRKNPELAKKVNEVMLRQNLVRGVNEKAIGNARSLKGAARNAEIRHAAANTPMDLKSLQLEEKLSLPLQQRYANPLYKKGLKERAAARGIPAGGRPYTAPKAAPELKEEAKQLNEVNEALAKQPAPVKKFPGGLLAGLAAIPVVGGGALAALKHNANIAARNKKILTGVGLGLGGGSLAATALAMNKFKKRDR